MVCDGMLGLHIPLRDKNSRMLLIWDTGISDGPNELFIRMIHSNSTIFWPKSFIFHSFDRKFRKIIHFSFIRPEIFGKKIHSFIQSFENHSLKNEFFIRMNNFLNHRFFHQPARKLHARASQESLFSVCACGCMWHVCCYGRGTLHQKNSLLGQISAFAFLIKMIVRSLLTLHPELHNLLSDHNCTST